MKNRILLYLLMSAMGFGLAGEAAEDAGGEKKAKVRRESVIIEGLKLKLLPIESGSFIMGSDDEGERPKHKVILSKAFWMGETELMQAQYKLIVGVNPTKLKKPDNPVGQVSWTDAMDFCSKLTTRERDAGRLPVGLVYRLPTEAEWEYCCRAGSQTAYFFGESSDKLNEYAWYKENSNGKIQPVKTRKPNKWGLYDMLGNVYEWCYDWYGNYPEGVQKDPHGPQKGARKINRGGCFGSPYGWFFTSAFRHSDRPGGRDDSVGFRIVLAPPIEQGKKASK